MGPWLPAILIAAAASPNSGTDYLAMFEAICYGLAVGYGLLYLKTTNT